MPNTPPIYFSTLEIENVRCFGGRQMLDLTTNSGQPAPWSLLIGENGAGKTTLLECLAWMHPVPDVTGSMATSNRLGGVVPLTDGILESALPGEENNVLETLPRIGSREVKLDAKLSFGGAGLWPGDVSERECNQVDYIGVGVQLSFDERGLLVNMESTESTQIDRLRNAFHDPLIVAYGSNRRLGDRNLLGIDELAPLDHERLSKDTELCDIEELLMSLDYATRTYATAPEASFLNLLKGAISDILPDDQGSEIIEIYPPNVLDRHRASGVYVKTFTGLVPLSALSLGYRTTAGWVIDLAWRFLNRYRDSSNPLAEPAIVLVDEIDLHLHPRWQLRIMKDLSSLFPATQFIATSHSPLIVQQASRESNLILLQKREDYVEIVNDTGIQRNLRVDQILTSLLFGLSISRDGHTESLFARRAELTNKNERSREEENLLSDVRRQIDELPTAQDGSDQAAMDRIRRFATRLEEWESNEL